MIHIGV